MRKIITTKASAANEAPIAIPAILAFERAGADSATGRIGVGVAEADEEDVGDLLAIIVDCVVVDGDVDEREVVERDVDELVDLMVDTVVEVIKVELRVDGRKEEVFLLE